MQSFNQSITDVIQKRFSCRSYSRKPICHEKMERMHSFLDTLPKTPFGTQPRIKMVAASEMDNTSLQGLGTYGFIKNPTAFIIGATSPAPFNLEDFGYIMEAIVLHATRLELGTCWLGGTFTKSKYAKKMNLSPTESIPAVISNGEYKYQTRQGWASRRAGSHRRFPWENLFFNRKFEVPLLNSEAGDYATVLEMVRVGPSASNKQPWRIVKDNKLWHFYLQRTPGYYEDPIKRILGLCDLQRLDLGIAMCHFELTARELGLNGSWVLKDNIDLNPNSLAHYVVSWECT